MLDWILKNGSLTLFFAVVPIVTWTIFSSFSQTAAPQAVACLQGPSRYFSDCRSPVERDEFIEIPMHGGTVSGARLVRSFDTLPYGGLRLSNLPKVNRADSPRARFKRHIQLCERTLSIRYLLNRNQPSQLLIIGR